MAPKKYTFPPTPIPKNFASSQKIEDAVKKIQRRIDQLQKLKDDGVKFGDHRVDTAEEDVKQTILKVFCSNSPEYHLIFIPS